MHGAEGCLLADGCRSAVDNRPIVAGGSDDDEPPVPRLCRERAALSAAADGAQQSRIIIPENRPRTICIKGPADQESSVPIERNLVNYAFFVGDPHAPV